MTVGRQRGHAQLALNPQVVEELLDGSVECGVPRGRIIGRRAGTANFHIWQHY